MSGCWQSLIVIGALFFENCTNVQAIELNFKHLLGRAPDSSAEISEHIQILATGGFEAEIDSYLDSDEYWANFGTDFVPYYRGYGTQAGKNVVGFTRSFPLFGSACSSDKSDFAAPDSAVKAALIKDALADAPSEIPDLQAIPESFPEELTIGPAPRIPKEIRAIGYELWQGNSEAPTATSLLMFSLYP